MIWFFAAGFLAMLVITVNEANDLRRRLVEEKIAHGETLDELAVTLAALAAATAERGTRPARLSCSFHHDRRNQRRITLYLN